MYNILVLDNVDKKAIDVLTATPGFNVTAGAFDRAQTLAAIPTADALIMRAGVGVDNVDLDAATEKGVVVVNTPDGNTISTAEMTIGLMLSLARFIPQGHASLTGGKWDRKSFTGVELRGKTLGLIGFGRIGRAVAKRALAFEMNIIAYDPFIPADIAADLGVDLVTLDELYAKSDFISLHSLITDDTKGMINAESIAKMKKGVRIVNAARGALINDADLAEALKSGQVAGAALDVYAVEPPPADHPLIGLPNVIDTPHLAASTSDAQVNVAIDAAQLVVDALTKGEYNNVCNPVVLTEKQE
jgi:D-3-phosphoglycerate dehydrogenase / 2-oxoglutarate reductase